MSPSTGHALRRWRPRSFSGSRRHVFRIHLAPALRHTRRVADQARLDRSARAANLAGAIEVSRRWREVVRGATCLLVDDVVTTGATMAEAARALRTVGAEHVVAAAVAATPRRVTPALVAHRAAD